MRRFLLYCPPFLLLYLLLFPQTMQGELHIVSRWVVDPAHAQTTSVRGAPLQPFLIKGLFGYVGKDGRLGYTAKPAFGVTLSSSMFVNYGRIPSSLVLQHSDGSVAATISSTGYPLFLDNRLFVFETDRAGVAEWDSSGSRLWSHEYGSLITSVGAANGLLFVGLLDGRAQLVDSRGAEVFSHAFVGSRVSAVYGVAISSSGSTLAVVHGLDPQRVTFFEKGTKGYVEGESVSLPDQYRSARFVRFIDDDSYLAVEDDAALLIVDVSQGTSRKILLSGGYRSLVETSGPSLCCVVTSTTGGSELQFFEPPALELARISVPQPVSFVAADGPLLLLGAGGSLMSIEVEVR